MDRRVVITGIGPITSIGIGNKSFFESILKLKTCIHKIPEAYERKYSFKSKFFVPAPEFRLTDFDIPDSHERIMEKVSKLSVVSAKLALTDAGFKLEQGDKYFKTPGLEDCAVIIGVGMSSLQTAFHSYIAHITEDENNNFTGTPHKYNRMVIPLLMPNSVAAWVSIMFGIKGFSYSINASCASGSYAIGEAYNSILQGRCDMAISGGVEALAEESGAIMRGFDMLTALTRSEDGVPRPFSKERSGFLFNEGACCLLMLEELERARNRGADIYVEITGFDCNSDSYNIAQIEPSGNSIVSMLESLSKGKKIDYINAHGTGTVPNDDIEARVIKKVFGGKANQPVINSTKGILGHSIGASGALEAAVTALSIKEAKIHGNLTEEPIDDLNLNMQTIDKAIDYAVSMSYGFGGHNAALLFKRYEENG